jgi:hypothetical protein
MPVTTARPVMASSVSMAARKSSPSEAASACKAAASVVSTSRAMRRFVLPSLMGGI